MHIKTHALLPRLDGLLWIIATLILVVLPHFSHIVIWIPPLFFLLLLWRYQIARHQKSLPSRWILLMIALVVIVSIAISYGGRSGIGRNAYLGLLVILCALKLLETSTLRDALLVCFLSYFLIITNFLYSQSIPTALYMGVVMLMATGTLISLNENSLSTRQRLRLSGILLFQAVPVMLVLFILFPRVAGPFWKLPIDAHVSVSGLGDTMSPGAFSDLSLSDEIAFRVKFEGALPPENQRYWRGIVLWHTDGHEWKRVKSLEKHEVKDLKFQTTGDAVDYTVTLEAHNRHWLFALDLPLKAPHKAYINRDYQILSKSPIVDRMRYSLRSYTDYHAKLFTPQHKYLALQLPKDKHLRARALAQQWQQENPQPQAIVQRALQYFNQEPFTYTRTPRLLLDDPIDDFLFKTREGFCEHYAAAFTILMRSANIPARVVTGYLGGTVNPIDHYLIVRQREAHAWSEVWFADRGWVRIDPTAAIAAERIEKESTTLFGFKTQQDSHIISVWQHIRNTWDAVNNGWNQWVLGYGPEQQKKLLERLGLEGIDWRGMTLLLVSLISSLLLGYAAWMFLRPQWKHTDPAQKIYRHWCKKMARCGLQRHPSEGPITFAQRISVTRPDLAESVEHIISLYLQTRYHSQFNRLSQLQFAVRHFHP